eukprot:6175461-Pleurochrysis_carterae.AAC.1
MTAAFAIRPPHTCTFAPEGYLLTCTYAPEGYLSMVFYLMHIGSYTIHVTAKHESFKASLQGAELSLLLGTKPITHVMPSSQY